MSSAPLAQTYQILAEHAPRTWQRMLSGRRLNLLEPQPVDIEITDIALGLSRNTRWNGQTVGAHAWSVAQHSLLVVDILRQIAPEAPPKMLLAGLLHDASEYVTHDIITPLKAVVGDVFREVERRLMQAVHLRFGLPTPLAPADKALLKRADLIAGATEAVQLAQFTEDELVPLLSIAEKPWSARVLEPLPSREAEQAFLAEFARLAGE